MVATSFLFAALFAVPALAAPLPAPEDSFTDIEARDPKFGKFLRGAGRIASSLLGREEEELAARDPKFGKFLRGAGRIAGSLLGREEELAVREPLFFGKILRTVGKVAGKLIGGNRKRELDDADVEMIAREIENLPLEAREPFLGFLAKAAAKIGAKVIGKIAHRKRELDDSVEGMIARELEDLPLEAREPFLGLLAKVGVRVAKSVISHRRKREYVDVEEEMFARDFGNHISYEDLE